MRVRTFYQARRVATQANAAGGAVIIDITPAAGQAMRIVELYAINSGTNSLYFDVADEDNAYGARFAAVGSAAGTQARAPNVGTSGAATDNLTGSADFIVPAGKKLVIRQLGAGAQNDTLTVAVVFELIGNPAVPTWAKDRSTNEADVTLAASTISAANTIQAVTEP